MKGLAKGKNQFGSNHKFYTFMPFEIKMLRLCYNLIFMECDFTQMNRTLKVLDVVGFKPAI